jgi:3-methyl-2-oxobutanoate hydroxymethyltransferase
VRHDRLTVADLRASKGKRRYSMLYVETQDEARAAFAAGIDMLSIIDPLWTPEMRSAAGDAWVQVGLLYGELCTFDDYIRAAHRAIRIGGDCVYCAASLEIVARLAAEGIPVIGHLGLVPSKSTWTGGFKAVGKTADQALFLWEQVQALEQAGAIGAELEVVPERLTAEIAKRSTLILLGMGAGSQADAQYLFAEDVLGYARGHKPRHAKTYADFARENARLQGLREGAFKAFKADVDQGSYPAPEHSVTMDESEFHAFLRRITP